MANCCSFYCSTVPVVVIMPDLCLGLKLWFIQMAHFPISSSLFFLIKAAQFSSSRIKPAIAMLEAQIFASVTVAPSTSHLCNFILSWKASSWMQKLCQIYPWDKIAGCWSSQVWELAIPVIFFSVPIQGILMQIYQYKYFG